MEIPLWLAPIVSQGRARLWHDTAFFVIPPGASTTIRWGPRYDGAVFHIFAMTFGKPRDYRTGEVVYTDEAFFWHRGKGLIWHFDPFVESIVYPGHPMAVTATVGEPLEIDIRNSTDITIVIDVTVWILEYSTADAELVAEYMRGLSNLFRMFSRVESLEELRSALYELFKVPKLRAPGC